MKWLSNASIDELGNGLVKNYTDISKSKGFSVDIVGFVTKYLKLPIIYHKFAEDDMSKLGFISDGKTPLLIFSAGKRLKKIFPKGTIVIEEFLCGERERGRRRFTIAHEAAHYIVDKSLLTASFHREFDTEQTYSTNDLKAIFSINEANVDRLAGAILMPEFMIKSYLLKHQREMGITVYDNCFIRPEDNIFLQRMANAMQVSFTALQIRITQLGLYEKRALNEYITEIGLGKEIT